jgi:hypothetical protein
MTSYLSRVLIPRGLANNVICLLVYILNKLLGLEWYLIYDDSEVMSGEI